MYTESLFFIISCEWLDIQIVFFRILPSYQKLQARVYPCRRTEEPRYLPCMFMIHSLSSVLQCICWSKKSFSNWRVLHYLTQVWVNDNQCLSCISRVCSTRVAKIGFNLVCGWCFKTHLNNVINVFKIGLEIRWLPIQNVNVRTGSEMLPVFFTSEST